jgi:hypothetical protein
MSDEEGSGAPGTPGTSGEHAASGELVYWWAPRGEERVFDLVGWPQDALHVVRSLLESAELEHRWEAGKLVVAAAQRQEAQEVLDEVVAASRPRLEADADRVAYELADWPAEELSVLEAALDAEGILAEWTEEGELFVYETDEERVDALFEELGLGGPDERIALEGEELTSLLNDVYLALDRLARDARDPDAVVGAVTGAREVAGVAPPLGFDERTWEQLSAQLAELRDVLEREDADTGDEEVSSRAREIRDRLRNWL